MPPMNNYLPINEEVIYANRDLTKQSISDYFRIPANYSLPSDGKGVAGPRPQQGGIRLKAFPSPLCFFLISKKRLTGEGWGEGA